MTDPDEDDSNGVDSAADRTLSNREKAWTPLECPNCYSHRVSILATKPLSARCVDCDSVYKIKCEQPPSESSNLDEAEADVSLAHQLERKGWRSAKHEGSEVIAATPIDPRTEGLTTYILDTVISEGPRGAIAAQHEAKRLAKELGAEVEEAWVLRTSYLEQLEVTHPACARRALRWRPRFLAAFQLTCSVMAACRAAKVSFMTYQQHKNSDSAFKQQCELAEKLAAELLHLACWKSAIDGDLEPVYWQGIKVGHIRKYDSRLRVELLRAHMPEKFKRGTADVRIQLNQTNNNLIMATPELTEDIRARRRAALEDSVTAVFEPSKPESIKRELLAGFDRGGRLGR